VVNKNVIIRYTVKPVLAFFSEYPLEQAARCDLMAFENPRERISVVSEGRWPHWRAETP
jgi:hypothetical protein